MEKTHNMKENTNAPLLTPKMNNSQEPINTPLLTHDQLQRELTYRAALSILKKMREAGLVSAGEFVTIAPILAKKFSPVWGDLYQTIA